jgi:dipeptidyl aminopeptidase/acylaminoacyl peptidase
MDRAGREVGRLGPVGEFWSFALAPDESRVAAAVVKPGEEKPDLWLFDSKRSTGVQLTFRGALRPQWAPDGRGLLFSNYDFALPMFAGVGNGIYRLTLGAPGVHPLGRGGPVLASPQDVTRDGKTLIASTVVAVPSILAIDMETGTSRPLVQDDNGVWEPRVSRDGKWITYTVLLPNRSEVYVEPLAGDGTRTQISVDGGFAPVWRDDGRELYYQSFDETLMRVDLRESGGQLSAAAVEPLFRVHTGGRIEGISNVAPAAHGQKFLVNTILGDSDNVPIEITMNWPELLK